MVDLPPQRDELDPEFGRTGGHWGDESVEDPTWVHRSASPHYPQPFAASVLEQIPISGDEGKPLGHGLNPLELSPDQTLELDDRPTAVREAFVVPVSEKASERISTENIVVSDPVQVVKIVERFEKRKSVLILNRSDVTSGTVLIGPFYGPSFPLAQGQNVTIRTQAAVWAILPAGGGNASLAILQEFED